MDNQQCGSEAIDKVIFMLNEQCAESMKGFHIRQFRPVPFGEYVLVLDNLKWTEADAERYRDHATAPDLSEIDVEKEARPHWFFDITERWTALPKVEFDVVPDFKKNPAAVVLVGLEGIDTKVCFLSSRQLNMKMVGEKEVQFAWAHDGRSSLYDPDADGRDLVDVHFAPVMHTLQHEDDA